MGFNSIQGIPPLPPVVGPRSSDVNRVFAAEFTRQQGGEAERREEYRRGLESDEEEEDELHISTEPGQVSGIHVVI